MTGSDFVDLLDGAMENDACRRVVVPDASLEVSGETSAAVGLRGCGRCCRAAQPQERHRRYKGSKADRSDAVKHVSQSL